MREMKMRVEARERKKEGEGGEEGEGKEGKEEERKREKKVFSRQKKRKFCEVLKIETIPFLKCSFTRECGLLLLGRAAFDLLRVVHNDCTAD